MAPPTWNGRYRIRGERGVRPVSVLDDGRFTYFRLPRNAEAPALFAREADGEEALVNFVVEGPYLVADRLAPAWRLRAGRGDAQVDNLAWTVHSDADAKGRP